MVTDALLAYLHFLCIFGLFATLSCEALLLRPRFIAQAAGWIWRVDVAYFVTALLVVASGLSRAVWGAKGWAFYAHNPLFHLKIGTFVLVALLSIGPTRRFLQWSRAVRENPGYLVAEADLRSARRRVLISLHLLTLMPLLAVFMARGFGLHGA